MGLKRVGLKIIALAFPRTTIIVQAEGHMGAAAVD